jgi:hypothetical protein
LARAFRKAGPDDKIARRFQAERRVKTGFVITMTTLTGVPALAWLKTESAAFPTA